MPYLRENFKIYNASAGSGKTFNLVKNYLITILSGRNDQYKKVLAMTFTNKAAQEMKERVLSNLKAFSDGEASVMMAQVAEEINISKEEVAKKAKEVLKHILNHYSDFQIQTLDSFTNRIINTFKWDLNLPAQFETVLDTVPLLEEAVEKLLKEINDEHLELKAILLNFAKNKIQEGKSWDIAYDLRNTVGSLLKEEDYDVLESLKASNIKDFKNLNKATTGERQKVIKQLKNIAENALQLITENGLQKGDFKYGDLMTFFQDVLKEKFEGRAFDFAGRLEKNIQADNFLKTSVDATVKTQLTKAYKDIKAINPKVNPILLLGNEVRKTWTTTALLKHLAQHLETIKQTKDVQLNAEFNRLIHEKIKGLPSPFIYERLGEKYRHFFIDEMQDTSRLQWDNLKPLLNETLSKAGGSLMLVGDGKQAIYRWRGGDPDLFIGLANERESSPLNAPKKVENLPKNYRSHRAIVDFNNDFFRFLSAKFFKNEVHQDLYQKSHQEVHQQDKQGYVQIDFVEKQKDKDTESEKIHEILKDIRTQGRFNLGDVCILTRKNATGVRVAQYLEERGMKVESKEALLIKNHSLAQVGVAFLKIMVNPKDEEARFTIAAGLLQQGDAPLHHKDLERLVRYQGDFLFKLAKHQSVDFKPKKMRGLPIYDQIQYLFAAFFDEEELFNGYLQALNNWIYVWCQSNPTGTFYALLKSWIEVADKKAIESPIAEDAVQVMTIHKSKGLEFPVVIYADDVELNRQRNPYFWLDLPDFYQRAFGRTPPENTPKHIRINKSPSEPFLEATKVHQHEHAQQLDNINMFYVALTRPVEQLYVVMPQRNQGGLKYYSQCLKTYLDQSELFKNEETCYWMGNSATAFQRQTEAKAGFVLKQHSYHHWFSAGVLVQKDHEAVAEGISFHELMQHCYMEKDVDDLPCDEVIKAAIRKLVSHQELQKDFFSQKEGVYNERRFVDAQGVVHVPDRLVFEGDRVRILDYKTGGKKAEHQQQVRGYASVLADMGYDVIRKTLCYVDMAKGAINVENF